MSPGLNRASPLIMFHHILIPADLTNRTADTIDTLKELL